MAEDVLRGDAGGEAAGVGDLQPVPVVVDLDGVLAPPVPVDEGVDQGLPVDLLVKVPDLEAEKPHGEKTDPVPRLDEFLQALQEGGDGPEEVLPEAVALLGLVEVVAHLRLGKKPPQGEGRPRQEKARHRGAHLPLHPLQEPQGKEELQVGEGGQGASPFL